MRYNRDNGDLPESAGIVSGSDCVGLGFCRVRVRWFPAMRLEPSVTHSAGFYRGSRYPTIKSLPECARMRYRWFCGFGSGSDCRESAGNRALRNCDGLGICRELAKPALLPICAICRFGSGSESAGNPGHKKTRHNSICAGFQFCGLGLWFTAIYFVQMNMLHFPAIQ